MNEEILERLLIDRALGQLPEDVEALLAEHLAASSTARKMAEEIQMTVGLAAKALPRARIAAPVDFRVPKLLRNERIQRGLALAASFVIGAGVAFLGLKGTMLQPDYPAKAPVVAAVHEARAVEQPSPEVKREVRSLPFWSNRRAFLLTTAESHKIGNHENP